MSQPSAWRRMPWATWAAVGTLFHSQAFAEQVSPSGTLGSYEVVSGCPPEAAFRDALRARLPESVRTPGVSNDFTVKIRRVASEGRFQYSGQLGQSSEPGLEPRRVQGASCPEVVEALALIAALVGQTAAASTEAREAARDEWTLTPEQEQALSREVDAPPELELTPEREGVRVGAVGFALFQSVAAPRPATDLGLGLTMSWETKSWQPWVMLGVYGGGEVSPISGTTARARFERWSSHLVACPLRFPRRSTTAVRPCIDLDVGRLTGTGLGVSDAAQPSTLMASAGLEARFEWSIWERIELGAMLGGVLPLARPRFYFEPNVTAFEVSALGLRASTSASLLF